jgi:tetratricopeptide (TPR) repeat protein
MKLFFFFIIIATLTICGSGCSQDPAPNAEQPAVETSTPELTIESVTDPNIALAEGKRLLDENQTTRAIQFLEHAVNLNPELAEAHFHLGIAYALQEMQNEQEGVAIENENTNSNDKTPPKTRSERAFEKAVEAYEKWVDANPKDDVAYYNLGRTYSKLMKDEEAEKAFKQAVKIKPDDTEYQTELGAILVKLAKYHEAIEPLKKAVELDAENVRAEELLEDAEAGRRRLDFVSPKPDANRPASNRSANANSESGSNSNSGTPARTSDTNTRPRPSPTGPVRKPSPSANRP